MTTSERLADWRRRDQVTEDQHQTLAALVRGERFLLYLELNGLMYLGVASMVAGIGWVARNYFESIGDGAIIAALVLIIAICFYYAFARAAPYSNDETSLAFAAVHEVQDRGLLFGREGQLAAGEREEQHVVVDQAGRADR